MSKRSAVVLGLLLLAAGCSKDPEVAKREFVQSGDRYAADKKLREAVVEYRNAIRQDPRFGEARRKLAETYLQLGDLRNAFQEFVRTADLLPNDADAQVKAGEMLLLNRQYADAKSRADKALAVRANHVPAQILRANALAGLNRLDDAIAEVEGAIRTDPDRSESYANLGMMQFVRGDRAQAEAAFKKAVSTDETSTPARLALANFYAVTGRRDEAEAQFREALAINPRDVLANRAQAYFYVASGRAKQAEANFKIIAEVAPNNDGKIVLADYYIAMRRLDEARQILGQVATTAENDGFATAKLRLAGLDARSDPIAASKLVEEVLAEFPSHTDALIAKAELLGRAGKFDESLAVAKSAAASNAGSARAQFAVGRAYVRVRDEVFAIAAFNQALQLNPWLADPELELARIHLLNGRLDEAEQFARSALTKVAGYADAHLLLARIYLTKGQPAKAEPSLKALEAAFPNSAAVQTELGLLELTKRNYPKARAAFSRALGTDPTHVEALAGMNQMDLDEKRPDAVKARMTDALRTKPTDGGILLLASRTYGSMGDLATAESMLEKAIAVDPNNLDAYGMLGRLYATQQRLGEATVQFEKLAEKHPKSVSAHTIVGMLLEMQNRKSDARARYERALEIDPRAAVAANNLAWMYAETGGNLDIALQLAQTAKAKLPDRAEVNDTLGWIYHKKGLSAMAVAPLLQSVQKDPANPNYHYHLGMAYLGSGDKDKGRVSLQKALSLNPNFSDAAEARQRLNGGGV